MHLHSNIQLPFGESHAFIIGINDYTYINPLRTAVNDAKGIAESLAKHHGYTVHGPLINPDKETLLDYITHQIPNLVKKDDRVLFYFAGHGVALNSDEGPNGYLVPADAKRNNLESLIPMEKLHQMISLLTCKHGLVILDCCFAGAFKWTLGFRDLLFELPNIIYEERFWRYCKDPAWQVITSAASDQLALDIGVEQNLGIRESGQKHHSPFANALLDGLEGKADIIPSSGGDGVITVSELYVYLRNVVETQTLQYANLQTPSMFTLSRHDKGEYIFLHPNHRYNLPPYPKSNPFMGFSPFEEQNADFFFGRTQVLIELEEKITKNPLLAITGASGTGKTSVINAGLIPMLKQQGYETLLLTQLGGNLLDSFDKEASFLAGEMRQKKKYLLVIDQYEEIFIKNTDSQIRQDFEEQIADQIRQNPNLRIVLGIRADFERCLEDSPIELWWKVGRYSIPKFSMGEVREIIRRPAEQAILLYEPDSLISSWEEETTQAPGFLPLLSYLLSELYDRYVESGREDRILTLEDFDAEEGIIGTLCTHADQLYANLSQLHRKSLSHLMLRMATFKDGAFKSQRIYVEDLIYENKIENETQRFLIDKLISSRIIQVGVEENGRIYYQLSHNLFVQSWQKLSEWINQVGENEWIVRRQLKEIAWQYHLNHKETVEETSAINPSLLWDKSPQLVDLKIRLDKEENSFTAFEAIFLRKSWDLRQKIVAKLNEERKTAHSVALSAKALQLNDIDATKALRVAEYAYNHCGNPSSESQEAIHHIFQSVGKLGFYKMVFRGHKSFVNDVAIDSTGKYILTGSSDQTAILWDVSGQEITRLEKHATPITAVSFVPHRLELVTAGKDGLIKFWDFEGRLLDTWEGNEGGIFSLSFSDNGKFLISGGGNATLFLWNLETQSKIRLTGHRSDILSTAFSPNNLLVISGGRDKTARIWNLKGEEVLCLKGHKEAIYHVSFSPNSKNILTGSSDKSAKLWDIEGELIQDFPNHPGIITAGLILPNNRGLITADSSGNATWWDLKGSKHKEIKMHQRGIRALKYQEEQIVTASEDNQIKLWNLEQNTPPTYRHPDIVWSVAYSTKHQFSQQQRGAEPDGYLLTGCDDGAARVWNLNGEEILKIKENKGAIFSVDFDKTGTYILTANAKGMVNLWDIEGRLFRQFKGHEKSITSVAFAPKGEMILTVSLDQTVRLWTYKGELVFNFNHQDIGVSFGVFCDGGNSVLTGTRDQKIRLWDVTSGKLKKEIESVSPALCAAVSPDQKYWLTGHKDYRASLWNSNGELIQHFIGHQKEVESVAFSSDGNNMLTGGRDKQMILWDRNGRKLYTFQGHESYVRDIISTDDGLFLFSVGDRNLRQWWTAKQVYGWLQKNDLYKLTQNERDNFGMDS